MTSKCTAKRFTDLRNPYTGEPMDVMLRTTAMGNVKFFCPNTYSTYDRQPTAELAYRRWNRINGVEGGKEGKPIVCAYTGAPLVLKHDEDGYWYEGGFNPHLMYDRTDFLRFATARGAVIPRPPTPARVDHIPALEKSRRKANTVELTDDAISAAEGVVKSMKGIVDVGSAAPVSMHVASVRKRRHG